MQSNASTQPLYVVSMGKFSALFLLTLGFYSFYWFYKHWDLIGKHEQRSTLPILRAVLNVFFFPGFCAKLRELEAQRQQQYHWNPQSIALTFISLQILSVIIGMNVHNENLHVAWLLCEFPILLGDYYCLYKCQLVANRVCDDPFGKQNSTLTPTNHIWIIAGIILIFERFHTLYLLISGQISL